MLAGADHRRPEFPGYGRHFVAVGGDRAQIETLCGHDLLPGVDEQRPAGLGEDRLARETLAAGGVRERAPRLPDCGSLLALPGAADLLDLTRGQSLIALGAIEDQLNVAVAAWPRRRCMSRSMCRAWEAAFSPGRRCEQPTASPTRFPPDSRSAPTTCSVWPISPWLRSCSDSVGGIGPHDFSPRLWSVRRVYSISRPRPCWNSCPTPLWRTWARWQRMFWLVWLTFMPFSCSRTVARSRIGEGPHSSRSISPPPSLPYFSRFD